jgi:hypothetical protein
MTLPEATQHDDLAAWDWVAELERQERSLSWLARHTDRNKSTVYRYAHGLQAPLSWRRAAARVLGREPAA